MTRVHLRRRVHQHRKPEEWESVRRERYDFRDQVFLDSKNIQRQSTPDGIARLMEHEWPGNVRELENCLMRALVVASGGVIHAEHLSIASPGAIRDERVASLEELERTHVTRVLELAAGHKGRAADLLGVSRPRLNRLIEKYGLQ